LDEILYQYGNLLREVDDWFLACIHNHAEQIVCHRGCSACCRGLFDITLLDALYLKNGFELLPVHIQSAIRSKAMSRLNPLSERWPLFCASWLLNTIPESEWDDIMPEDDETPCILLSEEGTCLVYDHRPMTCRLNGIPLIDSDGEELFDDWCTLNFIEQEPRLMLDIHFPFKDLFTRELLLFQEMTAKLLGKAYNELDTLIPAAVCMDEDMLVRLVNNVSQINS